MENKLFQKAKELFNNSQFTEVLPVLNELLDKEAYHLEAVLMKAIVLRKLSKFEESLQTFDFLQNLTPNDANVYAERGVTYLHMKYLDASLIDMDKAVSLEPNNPYRYSCRAYVKDKMQDDDGARLDYEKAIALDPNDEIAYNNLGLLLEKAGKKKAALKNFEQSNDILEKKYGIRIGKDEVRPYTFKDNTATDTQEQLSEKKTSTKVSLKQYLHVIKTLFNDKNERQAFLNFIKKKA